MGRKEEFEKFKNMTNDEKAQYIVAISNANKNAYDDTIGIMKGTIKGTFKFGKVFKIIILSVIIASIFNLFCIPVEYIAFPAFLYLWQIILSSFYGSFHSWLELWTTIAKSKGYEHLNSIIRK